MVIQVKKLKLVIHYEKIDANILKMHLLCIRRNPVYNKWHTIIWTAYICTSSTEIICCNMHLTTWHDVGIYKRNCNPGFPVSRDRYCHAWLVTWHQQVVHTTYKVSLMHLLRQSVIHGGMIWLENFIMAYFVYQKKDQVASQWLICVFTVHVDSNT